MGVINTALITSYFIHFALNRLRPGYKRVIDATAPLSS
jgi:hypothetical protein